MLNIYNGKSQIKAIWDKVKPIIENALPDFHEELIIEDVYALLATGRYDLWVSSNEGEFTGFFITQLFETNGGANSIHILYMGGVESDFYASVDVEFKEFLKRTGITKVQFTSSRSGMEKFCNKFQYKEVYTVFEGTLDGSIATT